MSRNPKSLAARSQLDTVAFKAWFAESQVVDSAGGPLVLYRGSAIDEGADFKENKDYIYAAPDASYAKNFAEGCNGANIAAFYFALRCPLDLTIFGRKKISQSQFSSFMLKAGVDCGYDEMFANMRHFAWEYFLRGALKQKLQAAGYDGLVWDERRSLDYRGGSREGRAYVAFRPGQIKSATGNCGVFDPTSPNICMSQALRERAR